MTRIVTVNVNGIRSANTKGLFNWLESIQPDIVCLQEIKASFDVIPDILKSWKNYHVEFHSAVKKGYSGVAIYSLKKPNNIIIGLNNPNIDHEGRYLQFDYDEYSVVSLYLPSGSLEDNRQQKKYDFMDFYKPILANQINSKNNHEYIICGDFNIAHNEIDIKNWKGNLKNSGFLPEERQWFGDILNLGYTDVWRSLYPDIAGYTWWSNRGMAYSKDVGWRIDYQICTANTAKKIKNAYVYKEQKFSDHAPLVVDYDF